jgi:hypothetical protein
VNYLWLGDEERGLAWFAENELGYEAGPKPFQEIERKGDTAILRIRLIGKPITLDRERTIVFGLMASPGKPLPENWRQRVVSTGLGPVVCWGGWKCASKYPDNGDYTIVEKIQEARRTGVIDEAWFNERSKRLLWPDRKMQDDPKKNESWLDSVLHFAQRAATDRTKNNRSNGTYFEEHATDVMTPEWQVFQDEWASVEFNRFQDKPGSWGVFSDTYHDFALWHANQWMSRGVSLYFDNTKPKRCYNERFGPGWRDANGDLVYGVAFWGPRQYYKRMWKLMAEWNTKGAPYPIDLTYHVTNTQTLPFNTWCSATVDHEQMAYRKPDGLDKKSVTPEQWLEADLPWPADHTRAVTMSRQTGSIPFVLDTLRGGYRGVFFKNKDPRTVLANWGMRSVHEIPDWMSRESNLSLQYDKALRAFGYPEKTVSHNYWEQNPYLTIDNANVKWLYLSREDAPKGLLLLQSYAPEEQDAQVKLPIGTALIDTETEERIPLIENKSAKISLPANYGTRMFLCE